METSWLCHTQTHTVSACVCPQHSNTEFLHSVVAQLNKEERYTVTGWPSSCLIATQRFRLPSSLFSSCQVRHKLLTSQQTSDIRADATDNRTQQPHRTHHRSVRMLHSTDANVSHINLLRMIFSFISYIKIIGFSWNWQRRASCSCLMSASID